MFTKSIYALSSFAAGFSLMTLELVSARLVAPLVGASVFTWTSVIGVTLLGLSIGSFLGGIIIDKFTGNKILGNAFIASSIFVFLVPFLVNSASFFVNLDVSVFWMVFLLSFYLFFTPSLAIGLLQPMILKMYARDFTHIGKEYGILSALWSFGSILGVFLTGFYFVSVIGSIFTLHIIASVLMFFGIYFFFYEKGEL
jgi:MFS family permease